MVGNPEIEVGLQGGSEYAVDQNPDEVIVFVSENGSSISRGAIVSSVFSFDSCCSSLVMARILTKVTSSGTSCPAALPKLPEELLVPAQSKRPWSRYFQ
jgi:hypothetical protein